MIAPTSRLRAALQLAACAALCSLAPVPSFAWQADNGDGTFTNPVLYADYPDPDIIRVGDRFFMVTTTFVDAPGIRILESSDLVNWTIAGHVAETVDGGSAYDLAGGAAYRGGYWACSLRHHDGVFYVAVNPTFGNARLYFADDVGGPWQYHQLDRPAYDPGLFIEEDGTGYLVSGNGSLTLMRLSADYSEVVAETAGFVETGGEGSHLVKRGEYYYLFNANPSVWPFQLLCSRAKDLLGPWETGRVALTATTGGHQGAIVELADGSWYGFVHQDSGAIGRVPRIGPVFWEDDWPVFGTVEQPHQIADTMEKPIKGGAIVQPASSDDFAGSDLGLQWQWNHNPESGRWSLEERPGYLRLRPLMAEGFWTARNTLTQKGQGPRSHGVVKLDLSGLKPGDVAGFGTLGKGNGRSEVRVGEGGAKTLSMRFENRGVGSYVGFEGAPVSGDTLYLRTDLDFERELGMCSYSEDGSEWTPLGGIFQLGFDITHATFQGQKYAIFCFSETSEQSQGYLDVDSFTLGDTAEMVSMQRGRPRLNASGTTFVGDNGQLMRGHFTSTEWSDPPSRDSIASIKELGSNAVHLYGEVFDPNYPADGSQGPGYAADRIDAVVEMTRELGLYLVITIGNGANNGSFNHDYVIDFWDFYAPRYKDETHVIYEIQNEPVAWSPPYSQAALDMQVEAYDVIRSHAPDTPVLLFSYSVLGSSEAAMQDLNKIGSQFDWSNTGIAFHGYAGYETTAESIAGIIEAGYPVYMTEFTTSDWGYDIDHLDLELTAALERMEISWLSFLHIPPNFINQAVTEPGAFYDIVNNGGLSWTPDFGDWPVARGVFGNDGLPRSTTGEWEGNRLVGALRLEAEDFDWGGQGVAYSDRDAVNRGGSYRPEEGVDLYPSGDSDGSVAVGRTEAGEWLEYTLFVREAGYYTLGVRYASDSDDAAVRTFFNEVDVAGRLTLADSGGSQSWTTLERQVFLEYGRQKLRVEVLGGGAWLNWVELEPAADGPIADGTYRLLNRRSGLAMQGAVSSGEVVQSPYGGEEHEWIFEHLGAGQYRVRFAERTRYWSVFYQEDEEPLDLVGWWNLEEARQRYLVSPAGDGYYLLRPADGGLSLGVESASSESGAPILQYRYAAEAHQQWAMQSGMELPFPVGLSVALEEAGYALSWQAAEGATRYTVKRSAESGGPFSVIASDVASTAYLDTDVEEGEVFYYLVSASDGERESLDSAVAAANPPRLIARFGFEEGAGSISFDETDGGWTAALLDGAEWGQGRDGGALELDGAGGHALLSDGIVSQLDDFTMAAWVYLDGRAFWSRIFDFGTGTNNYMFMTPNGGQGTYRFAITTGSGEQVIDGTQPLPLGEWLHVAVSLEGSTGILYLNGEEVGRNEAMSLTPSDLGETDQNYLGKSQWPDPYLDGRMDDVRIYTNALGADGIRALFEAAPRPPIEDWERLAPRMSLSDGVVRIELPATVAGRGYRIEASDTLMVDSWAPLGAIRYGDGGALVFAFTEAELAGVRYFRIRIVK